MERYDWEEVWIGIAGNSGIFNDGVRHRYSTIIDMERQTLHFHYFSLIQIMVYHLISDNIMAQVG